MTAYTPAPWPVGLRPYEVVIEFENKTQSLPQHVQAEGPIAAAFKVVHALFGRDWKELVQVSENRWRLARNKRTLSNCFVRVALAAGSSTADADRPTPTS